MSKSTIATNLPRRAEQPDGHHARQSEQKLEPQGET